MAQAQDSERAAAVLLDRASFRYVDESERGLEAEAGSAAPASGSRVDDVSLSVAPGRCLVLCGRSGDGKSTVLRLVDGLAGTFFPGDLTGVVEVCADQETKDFLWRDGFEKYYPKGATDPDYCVFRFTAQCGNCWMCGEGKTYFTVDEIEEKA